MLGVNDMARVQNARVGDTFRLVSSRPWSGPSSRGTEVRDERCEVTFSDEHRIEWKTIEVLRVENPCPDRPVYDGGSGGMSKDFDHPGIFDWRWTG